MLTRDFTK